MSKKKKVIILTCMIALLAVSAVFNFVLSKDGVKDSGEIITTASYFSQYRTDRTSSRNEQMLQLDEIISSSDGSSEVKTNALKLKLKLTEITEKEFKLEHLMRLKGFENAVVVLSLTSDNVKVIVQDSDFNQDDAISVYSLLAEEISATPENVKIIPIS